MTTSEHGSAGAVGESVHHVGRVAIIGVGRMGSALASSLVAADGVDVGEVVGAEPDPEVAHDRAEELGIEVVTEATRAVDGADVVLVAVKPHLVAEVLGEVADAIGEDTVVASVAAGITTTAMVDALGPGARVVRVMPNTPMLVGRGMSVVTGGGAATDDDVQRVAALLDEAGEVLVLPEERFDAVTGVSGSGPAWVFALAEAMVQGAEAVGLDHDDAITLVEQTVAGAGHLLRTSEHSAGALREMVSSPGGTTLAGLEVLGEHGFGAAVEAAIAAATERSRELGA